MKKLFLSFVAMMIAAVGFAQTSLLATLSHDGTISTFYGTTALKEALAKADNGDAITLSAGQFLAANIEKAVTLRGAGMNVRNDSINSHESTIVQGDFELNIGDSISERLIVEGVYFTSTMKYKGKISNALFMKSRFGTITADGGTLVNSSFIHSRIASGFTLSSNSNACMINSVVQYPYNSGSTASNFEFDNCIVGFNRSITVGMVINSYYKNCIINDAYGSNVPSSNVCYNCVGMVDDSYQIFNDIVGKNSTNKVINNHQFSLLYKSVRSYEYNDSEKYELTDEAKTKYLGTDGKEVGLYGGSLPYEEDPTTPQITKCNVAAKSTADGKLSVDIEVKAAEY